MRWNAAIHRKRPPASNKGARWAWDHFVRGEARTPKEMTYKFMDYWVWVMEFTNGDFEEIDSLISAWHVRNGNRKSPDNEVTKK